MGNTNTLAGQKMKEIDVSEVIGEWQNIVDLLAKIIDVPAGLIMRLDKGDLEVFVSSQSKGNPYIVGEREAMENSGLYCETVIKKNSMLKIPNALTDKDWKDNPDVKLNMISYLGLPILYPNGSPFGTICVLDSKENHYTDEYEELLYSLRKLIERELEIIDKNVQLKISSETDPLTEINNRLSFMVKSSAELQRAKRYGRSLSLLMIDLDDFKAINDEYGHQMGDVVLKMIAKTVLDLLRKSDIFGRYGGEEFILTLPETEYDSAMVLANRIIKEISNKEIFLAGETVRVTASIGVSVYEENDTFDDVIKRADLKMYEAKKAGKNQVK